jgi:hypothetical protein
MGGAIAIVRIFNSTLSGNFSGFGGGIESDSDMSGATVEIGSTILNATTLATIGGGIASFGYNLTSDDGSGFLGATGDQINTDPMLGPLQLNGGQTPTHALFGASPAVDAGTNFSGLATDQRGPGFARTVDINLIPNAADGTDIGAFELQASEFHPQPPTITSTNVTTFITGYSNSFRIVATGIPTNSFYETGILPAGTGLSTKGILSGIPPLGSGGTYPLTVIASNGVPPMATQYFTLSVVEYRSNTVYNAQDSGPGSLRDALANATNSATITFWPSVTGTIKLFDGQLTVSNGVTIVGPGANVLAVDGNGYHHVFYVTSSLPVSISGLTITNGNAITGAGGGIDNEGSPLTVSNCVVTGNQKGGIFNYRGVLNVYNSTLSGNSNAGYGGALYNYVGGSTVVHIYNSTISSNSSAYDGGALYNYAGSNAVGTIRIVNSTFSGNSSGYTNGISNEAEYNGSATVQIGSTILNATPLATVGGGTIQSLGYNLSSDNGGGFLGATGDQTNTNPLLGPLQLNGGQTPTHALLSGSPAIDAGTNFSGLATDQRGPGFARTVDITGIPNLADGTDIGAFELQSLYAQAVLADHPLGYWRLDETNGLVAYDSVGGNNGVYTNTLLGQPGDKFVDAHPAVVFGVLAPSNSYVGGIPIDFSTTGNAEFSVEAWVAAGPQTSDAGIITKGYGSGGEQFTLDTGSDGGNPTHAFRFFVRNQSGTAYAAYGSMAPDGKWHHLVGVCDQSNGVVKLYIDGVTNATGAIPSGSGLLSSASAVTFGARQLSASSSYNLQFAGTNEEFAIYNYALSAAQVRNHFAAASPPIIATASRAGSNFILNWSGGIAPYQVQIATNLGAPLWQNLGAPVSSPPVSLSPSNQAAFFRILGN